MSFQIEKNNDIEEILRDKPAIFEVSDLANLIKTTPGRIYAKRSKQARGTPNLLPRAIAIPNSNRLIFCKSAVREWLENSQHEAREKKEITGRRGRPKGSLNRKGIGRANLEEVSK